MAAYSRRCSDEELQKAISYVDELVARRGPTPANPDEREFPGLEEHKNSQKEGKNKDAAKKKKTYTLSPEHVEMMLSYECEEFPAMENLNKLAKEKGGHCEDLRTAVSPLHVFGRHYQDGIRATQEMMKHQPLTQGCITYEATDDEAEEEAAAAAAQQGTSGGGGGRSLLHSPSPPLEEETDCQKKLARWIRRSPEHHGAVTHTPAGRPSNEIA